MDTRLRAISDLSVAASREIAGRHEYDGTVQDLSPYAVRRGLDALNPDRLTYDGRHDEAHAGTAEDALRARFGELELHRVNPLWHIDNLELITYDRRYAPAADRARARRAHLKLWPDAVDAAIEALDRVPRDVAAATVPLAEGLGGYLGPDDDEPKAALARFVSHLGQAAEHGPESPALGGAALTRLLSSAEAMDVDLHDLLVRAQRHRAELREMLDDACRRIDSSASTRDTLRVLLADHPTTGDGVLAEARELVTEVLAWTARTGLVPVDDAVCEVGPTPESQRRSLAGLYAAAPFEPDGPSSFLVTLPDPGWSRDEQREWLAAGFNRAQLPDIAVHEVAPGHFSHFRALRRAPGDVRRLLVSDAFVEGWAHYVEQLCVEEGFRSADPRFAAGVARDGLRRVARLICSIGLHTGALSLAEAAASFAEDALITGRAAYSEVRRALFDPTYGRYTWGKLEILRLRAEAQAAWGAAFSPRRLHDALFALGAPPLGLMDTALLEG